MKYKQISRSNSRKKVFKCAFCGEMGNRVHNLENESGDKVSACWDCWTQLFNNDQLIKKTI